MKRSTNYTDLSGEATSRFNEPLIDRLEYCRAMLRVHGLLTEDEDVGIADEISERRVVLSDEYAFFAESEESEAVDE